MTTDTLQDYEALIDSGSSEQQAKAMVRTFAAPRTDPEVLETLNLILHRLDAQDEVLNEVKRDIAELKEDNQKIRQELTNLGARVQILEDRFRTETRVTRLINTTLIALAALAASLASILTR